MSKAAPNPSVEVGTVIGNTYQIASILGRGGMGTVWEATHLRLPGKRVAIKVLHANAAEDPESLARFRREAEIACRLGHPNIVEVHDFNHLEDGSPYLVLEMLEGQSLDARLREGPLDLASCMHVARQIASALQCAHEQDVIHRDLKPQNIFLVPSSTGEGPPIVKVLDFGISKIRGSQTVKTQDSTLLGTPQYMAPEQATGNHDAVDARTDLFALAAMLYELLSGKPAFSGQSIPEVVYKVVHVEPAPVSTLVPDIPSDKAAALHKALSKAPGDRFADIASFIEAFTGSPMAAPRLAKTPRTPALGNAATIDSSKIDFAQAATFDSRSQEMPAALPPPDLADAVAETIDSSKLDRMQASIQITGGQIESMDVKLVESKEQTGPSASKVRTYVITMMVVCGAAIALLFAMPKEDSASRKLELSNSVALNEAERSKSQDNAVPSASAPREEEVPEDLDPSERETEEEAEKETEADAEAEGGPSVAFVSNGLAKLNDDVPRADTARVAAKVNTKQAPADSSSATPSVGGLDQTNLDDAEGGRNKDSAETAQSKLLLDQADIALKKGQSTKAIFAARKAYQIQKNPRSPLIVAKARCIEKRLGEVRAALRKVPPKNRAEVREFCKEVGFPLSL